MAKTTATVEDVLRANERNIRDAQQRKLPEAHVFLQDKITPPEKSEPKALDTERCFSVDQYELEGLASSMPAPPKELLERYTGPCVGAQQLNDLLGELNAWFQAQGWITTRAYIGGCPKFCVNGQMAGNCRTRKMNHDRNRCLRA